MASSLKSIGSVNVNLALSQSLTAPTISNTSFPVPFETAAPSPAVQPAIDPLKSIGKVCEYPNEIVNRAHSNKVIFFIIINYLGYLVKGNVHIKLMFNSYIRKTKAKILNNIQKTPLQKSYKAEIQGNY